MAESFSKVVQGSDRYPHTFIISKDNSNLNTANNFHGFCSSEKETKMTKINFNKTNLEKITSVNKRVRYYAEECKGLHLDVLTSGKKVFRFNYKLNYRSKYFTIGEYPLITPYLAIKTARELFQQVKLGNDPQLLKLSKRTEPSFKNYFIDEYLQIKLNKSGYIGIRVLIDSTLKITFPDSKDKKLNGYLESWNAHLRHSKILNKKMSEITHTDIQYLFNKISKNSKSFANRIIRELRAIFNTNLQLTRNPVSDALKVSIKLHSIRPRKIKISNEDLNQICKAAIKVRDGFNSGFKRYMYPGQFLQANAILIMIFEGMRPNEVLKMKWSQIDINGVYTVESKTGEIKVPLSDVSLNIINSIPKNSDFIFPAPKNNTNMKSVRKTWITIQTIAGTIHEEYRLYDIRKTFSSRATKRFDLFQSSKLTNHSSINVVEKHYSHLDNDEIRTAKNILANLITIEPEALSTKKDYDNYPKNNKDSKRQRPNERDYCEVERRVLNN